MHTRLRLTDGIGGRLHKRAAPSIPGDCGNDTDGVAGGEASQETVDKALADGQVNQSVKERKAQGSWREPACAVVGKCLIEFAGEKDAEETFKKGPTPTLQRQNRQALAESPTLTTCGWQADGA